MSADKETDRARRKKRRGQQSREKGVRRASQARAANLESKANDEKAKLDLRISKLIDQGYSPDSVAKRLGVTVRRINRASMQSADGEHYHFSIQALIIHHFAFCLCSVPPAGIEPAT